ncbi:MAG: sigma-70 family RNA polymerase sigma factor [Nannocystaceae bacterium]|nr:sigma-70 family RNA polymerase sigma factor [Nannocystaceae bacterium]
MVPNKSDRVLGARVHGLPRRGVALNFESSFVHGSRSGRHVLGVTPAPSHDAGPRTRDPRPLTGGGVDGALQRGPRSELTAAEIVAFLEAHELGSDIPQDRLDDIVLARACAAGSRAAISAFTQRFQPLIRAIGTRSLDTNDVDDYQQSAVSHLLLPRNKSTPAVDRYDGRGSLHAFVRMVASRLAIDVHRAQRVAPVSAPAALEHAIAEGLNPGIQMESAEVRSAVAAALVRALRHLKPLERRTLRMRYVLGFSVASTATALGVHKVSVSRIVSRVRSQIREQVGQELRCDPRVLTGLTQRVDISVARWLATNAE